MLHEEAQHRICNWHSMTSELRCMAGFHVLQVRHAEYTCLANLNIESHQWVTNGDSSSNNFDIHGNNNKKTMPMSHTQAHKYTHTRKQRQYQSPYVSNCRSNNANPNKHGDQIRPTIVWRLWYHSWRKSLAKVQENEIIGTNFGAKLVDAVHGGQLP